MTALCFMHTSSDRARETLRTTCPQRDCRFIELIANRARSHVATPRHETCITLVRSTHDRVRIQSDPRSTTLIVIVIIFNGCGQATTHHRRRMP